MNPVPISLLIFLCVTLSSPAYAQSDTHLYMFSLQKSSKGEYHIYAPKYLSAFNVGGYTNQPWFTPDGDILVSVRKRNEIQNDIWLLDPGTKKYRRLTRTNATEYSPRMHPDEERLTFLRKIGEEPLDQQVYAVDLKSGELKNMTLDIKDIGYYTWLSFDELAIFRIDGAGNKLSYYDMKEHKSRRLTSSIGRTLLSDKEGRVIYVHKFTEDYWYIKKYNPSNSNIDIVVQTVGKSEDFAIGPDGTYFMAKDHVLHYFNPGRDKEWKPLSDLSIYGIRHISRIAISPNGKELVLVDSKEKS